MEEQQSIGIVGVLVPGVIVLALIYFFCLRNKDTTKKRKGKSGSSIFIVGELGAGKTSLLYLLDKNPSIRTTSSLVENEAEIKLEDGDDVKNIPCIDIPGHVHKRSVLLDRMSEARCILVLADSTKREQIASLASLIYDILICPNRNENTEICITLNKQDLPNAIKSAEFQNELSAEIERLKISKKAIASDDEEEDYDILKHDKNKFEFADYSIKFVETSITNNDIKQLQDFLLKVFFD